MSVWLVGRTILMPTAFHINIHCVAEMNSLALKSGFNYIRSNRFSSSFRLQNRRALFMLFFDRMIRLSIFCTIFDSIWRRFSHRSSFVFLSYFTYFSDYLNSRCIIQHIVIVSNGQTHTKQPLQKNLSEYHYDMTGK